MRNFPYMIYNLFKQYSGIIDVKQSRLKGAFSLCFTDLVPLFLIN
jgi:hypothetical protein